MANASTSVEVLKAIKNGEIEALIEYYDTHDVNDPVADDRPAIMMAASYDNKKVIAWLVARGADINQIAQDSSTALAIAVGEDNLSLAKHLVKLGAKVNLQTPDPGLRKIGIDNPVLAYSLRTASAKSILWLVKQGAQLSTESGNQNLIAATIMINRNYVAARDLTDSLQDLTQPFRGGPIDGLPQICLAAATGASPVVEKYLQLRGDANLACLQASLFNMSIATGNDHTMELLLDAGARISSQDQFKAISAGTPSLIDATIDNRKKRQISIFQAVANGDTKALKRLKPTLSELNRDVSISDFSRVDQINSSDLNAVGIKRPLLSLVAADGKDVAMLKTLKKLGANLEQESYGTTPLSVAVFQQDMDCVTYLTELGQKASPYLIENSIEKQLWPLATYLLNKNPQIRWQDFTYPQLLEAPIVTATQTNQVKFLRAALTAGYSFQDWNSAFRSPFIPLIEKANIKILRIILTSLPEHQRFREFMTETAIESNQIAVLELLYELGMNNQNAPFSSELLNLAAMNTNSEVLEYLIKRKWPLSAPDFSGTQALLLAAQNNNRVTFEKLAKQKLGFWLEQNPYSAMVIEEIFGQDRIDLFHLLLDQSRGTAAPIDSEIPKWAARKSDPEWMRIVYGNGLFAQAIEAQRPDLASEITRGMADKSDEEIQYRAGLFRRNLLHKNQRTKIDRQLIDAMLARLTGAQLSAYFSLDRLDSQTRSVLKSSCLQAATNKAQSNCQQLEGLLDETSLSALVLAIEQNLGATITDWLANTDKQDWPTLTTPLSNRTSIGAELIRQDNEETFLQLYDQQMPLSWEMRRLIAEENAKNIFAALIDLDPVPLMDLSPITDRAAELGNIAFLELALASSLRLDWQNIVKLAVQSDRIDIVSLIASREEFDEHKLLELAVDFSAADSTQFLLGRLELDVDAASELLLSSIQQLAKKASGETYIQQLRITRLLLTAGAVINYSDEAGNSSLGIALKHRMLGVLAIFNKQQILDAEPFLTTFVKAAYLHDLTWLNALVLHTTGWPESVIQDAYYLAAGDPVLQVYLEALALKLNIEVDATYQPDKQIMAAVLLERYPAFEAIGYIQQLQTGTLLVSDRTAAIVNKDKTFRRLSSTGHTLNPLLTQVNEKASTLFLIGNEAEFSAWDYGSNQILWRHSIAEPIQSAWFDHGSNELSTLLRPTYGEGSITYERRAGATGERLENIDLKATATSLGITIGRITPQLIPNSSNVILVNDRPYPEEGSKIQILNFRASKLEQEFTTDMPVYRVMTDTRFAAFEGLSDGIEIWDLATGLLAHKIELSAGYHNLKYFQYPHLVTIDDKRSMSYFNVETGERHLVTNPSAENFHAATFQKTDRQIYGAGYQTNEWYVFGQPTPIVEKPVALSATLASADPFPYVQHLVTNGRNLAILDSHQDNQNGENWLWRLDRARPLRSLGSGSPIELSSDNRRLISQQDQDQVSLIDTHTGEHIQQFTSSDSSLLKPTFASNGRELWFLRDFSKLSVINTWSDQVVDSLPLLLPVAREELEAEQSCHLLLPDQGMLALCLTEKSQLLFSDIQSGEIVATINLDSPAQRVYSLDQGRFFILDAKHQGYWISDTLALEGRIAIPSADSLAIHGPSNQVAIVKRDEGLKLFDKYGGLVFALSKESLNQNFPLRPDHVVFVQDGKALLLAGPERARIISLDKSEHEDLAAASGRILNFEVDGDQSLLNILVDSSERTNVVWDLSTGAEIKRFKQGNLFIGPNRNLHGAKQDFSGDTQRFDLNTNTWHESKSQHTEPGALGLIDMDIETSVLHYSSGSNDKTVQILLKTRDKLQWITKDNRSGDVISRLELPELLPFVADRISAPQIAVFNNQLALFANHTVLLVELTHGDILWRTQIPAYFDQSLILSDSRLNFVNQGSFLSLRVSSQAKDIANAQLIINTLDGKFNLEFVNQDLINPYNDTPQWLFLPDSNRAIALKLYPNGNLEVMDAVSKNSLKLLQGHLKKPNSAHLIDRGRRLVTSSEDSTLLWRLDVDRAPLNLDIGRVQRAFMAKGHLWLLSKSGGLEVFQTNGNRLAKLITMANGSWLVAGEDGRYDSNRPGQLEGIGWVVSDTPLDTLPVEVFMKQYYEPRLLPRLLGQDTFVSIPNLATVNRQQPGVSFQRIQSQSEQTVSVTINVRRPANINTADSTDEASRVFDLRLLRDGKQIAHYPEDHGSIVLQPDGTATVTFNNIALPESSAGDTVKFEAMAFNNSGIKSPTAQFSYSTEQDSHYKNRRAFVINVGVNHYSHPRWNLAYAVNDATAINQSLTTRLASNFDEVISIPILTTDDAWVTEMDISNVLAEIVSGSDQHNPLTPRDSILFTWAGHGFASADGEFHLITSNVGDSGQVDDAFLEHSVSTTDLTRWFEPLDADNIIMVIDACNSAASVEGKGFKPGPMGSRGFGQLAWFKGMQIITASQSDDVALESATIKHGLLTYSMVIEGLDLAAADNKPANNLISTSEWLEYGQQRVPQLFIALKSGNLEDEVLDKRGLTPPSIEPKKIEPQTPALFNFKKNNQELEMSVN